MLSSDMEVKEDVKEVFSKTKACGLPFTDYMP